MANAVYTRYLGDISREYIEILCTVRVHGTSWTAVRRRPFDGVGLRWHLEPLIIEEHKLQVRDSIDSTSQPPRLTVTPPPLPPPPHVNTAYTLFNTKLLYNTMALYASLHSFQTTKLARFHQFKLTAQLIEGGQHWVNKNHNIVT